MREASAATASQTTPLAKLGTGVTGLDAVLDGGYPESRTTMVKGGPGAGKTLFALQFLVQNALRGAPGVFVTFEEGPEAVRLNAATLGWDLPALEAKGLLFIYRAKLDTAAVTTGQFSLDGLMAIIDGKARAMGAKALVIDAIDILMRRFESPERVRDELNALHDFLDRRTLTAILSIKASDSAELAARFGFIEYMADCVVELDHRVLDQISTRRLRVLKYRGSAFRSNEFPYVIGGDGISLVPIGSVDLGHRPLGKPQPTGNAALDDALRGGYRRSSCVLLAGPSGSGKTTLACTFVAAAAARGERVLYISFEEAPEALASSVKSAGIDLGPGLRAGQLEFICRLPEATGSDEHLFQHLQAIERHRPDHVVVDAISACVRMGSGKAPFDYVMRLVNACKEKGITCLLTNQLQGSDPNEDLSGLGFTSLVDTLVQLRLEVGADRLERSLVVWKARGCGHSQHVHDLRISDDGIVLASRASSHTARSAR
ncbi:MAG: circadian clock protein KaiC [Myxococcota bacterium]